MIHQTYSIWRSGPDCWVWLASLGNQNGNDGTTIKTFDHYCDPKWGYNRVLLVMDRGEWPDSLINKADFNNYCQIVKEFVREK